MNPLSHRIMWWEEALSPWVTLLCPLALLPDLVTRGLGSVLPALVKIKYTGALEEGWAENLYWSLNLVPGETGMNLEESQRGRGSLKLYVNRGTEDWESNSWYSTCLACQRPWVGSQVGAGRGTSQKPDPESSQKRKQQDRDFPMIVAQDQRWSPSLTSLCNSA